MMNQRYLFEEEVDFHNRDMNTKKEYGGIALEFCRLPPE